MRARIHAGPAGPAAALVALGLCLFLAPGSASATEKPLVGPRFAVQLGAWSGFFAQNGYGQTARQYAPISPGAALQLGFSVGHLVFVEYNATYLGTLQYSGGGARFWSPLGANAGLDIPFLPIEVYGGVERGDYSLTSGNAVFSGTLWKAGVATYLIRVSNRHILGFKGELRRQFVESDQAGRLPGQYSTRVDTYFVGISIGFNPSEKP